MRRIFRYLIIPLILLFPLLALADDGIQGGPMAWAELGPINVEHGVSVRNSNDGQNEPAVVGGSKCRVNLLTNESQSFCYYFDYDSDVARLIRPVYVTVEYFDEGFGTFRIQYDSADINASEHGAYKNGDLELLLDSREWRKFTFELPDARFDGRESLNADFRLICSGRLAIRRISIEMGTSDAFTQQRLSRKDRIPKSMGRLSPLKGMQITFSGIEPATPADTDQALEGMRLLAPVLRILGATSVESCVRWSLVEQKQGQWDWSYYDRLVDILRENGLKWNPYVMIGPVYSTPGWFHDSKDSVFATCLEHNSPSKIQSIWSPNLPGVVNRFITQFSLHYGASSDIESILIGISGDYGEAIYPVTSGGWMAMVSGNYHTHLGYWCGDDYAKADFRRAVTDQYVNIHALNTAWGTSFTSFDQISPFVPDADYSARARLDLIKWYRGCMTNWANYWLSTTRERFPMTPIYLCTGGDGQPAHGSDFSAQCKTAADHRAGVRVTNEATDYALSFADTRLVSSACRQYGTYSAFESMGAITTPGIIARIFSAATSGVRGIHVYYPAVLSEKDGIETWSESYKWLGSGFARPKIAVLYPQTALTLSWGGFYEKVMLLRDAFDFDLVDESMIRDGALKQYRVLVLPDCKTLERDDIIRIQSWVRSGGVIVTCESSRFSTVEGDATLFSSMIDVSDHQSPVVKEYGAGLTVYVAGGWGKDHNPVAAFASVLDSLSTRTQVNLVPDGEIDGVYVTYAGGRFLVLNTTQKSIERDLQVGIGKRQKCRFPAGTITEVQ